MWLTVPVLITGMLTSSLPRRLRSLGRRSSVLLAASKDAEALQLRIDELVGYSVNCNSPKQVSTALFGTFQSTNRKALLEASINPDLDDKKQQLARLVLEYRQLSKTQEENSPIDNEDAFSPTKPPPLDNESSIKLRKRRHVSPFERQVNALFQTKGKIDPYWKEHLLKLSRPTSQGLVNQLHSDCPMGYDPQATPYGDLSTTTATTAGKKGTFLDFCRQQKLKYPDCVIVTRCGDFFETFGLDALLLTEYCGLNAMAGKAKAGCPIRNIQATLDGLTQADFRVAVFEEGTDMTKGRIKSRFLAQIVSSASPTYLYDLVLQSDTVNSNTPAPRPHMGVVQSHAGYSLVEVHLDERTCRVSERLTQEAVVCRLAANPPADPILLVMGEEERRRFPTKVRTHRIDPNLVQQSGNGVCEVDRVQRIVVGELLRFTERKESDPIERKATVDDFCRIQDDSQTRPLYVETATQLGLMSDPAIPGLVNSLLNDHAPAACKRLLRRWLLTPPPPHVADSMRELIRMLMVEGGPALPPLTIPPMARTLAMIRAGQASATVFAELLQSLHATIQVLDLLEREDLDTSPLMSVLKYESGMAADAASLRERCADAIDKMEETLSPIHHVGRRDHDEQVCDFGELIPRAFLERNECSWRARVKKSTVPLAYERVECTARELATAIARDFWNLDDYNDQVDLDGKRKPGIVQDIFNNLLALKEVPSDAVDKEKFLHPRDRNGKVLRNRYTTPNVESHLSAYVSASEEACKEVAAALTKLSVELQDEGHLPAIVQACHTNLLLSAAYYHASMANANGWNLGNTTEPDEMPHSGGYFDSVWPYWMDGSEGVMNSFDLNGMFVLTAPNMSGKSTLMRSTAAAALLTVCGLCAPLGPNSQIRRFDHIFVRGASSDVPTERKSAFGAEMGDIAALLRACGSQSLVFVDELGRGTSPRDGTRLAAAVLESMAQSGMHGIFATHLHDIFTLPLQADERIVRKRMAINNDDASCISSWTYQLEDGVCTDSMALVTASHFGLPASIIQRANDFAAYLPANQVDDPQTPVESSLEFANLASEYGEHSKPDIRELILSGIDQSTVCELQPGWSIPASLESRSVVYVLELDTKPERKYYVGETDNVRKRFQQHRSKGVEWKQSSAFIAAAPKGKSQARLWENQLIRKLAAQGFALESIADGRSQRFLRDTTNSTSLSP